MSALIPDPSDPGRLPMGWRSARLVVALLTVMLCACNFGPFSFQRPTTTPLGYENSDQSCEDGLDNDQDGLVDCEDPDCVYESTHCGEIVEEVPFWQSENNYALCIDQVDNDDDGQFDCGDRKCQNIPEVCCSREFTNEQCQDGIDNDANGYTDCQDFGCRNGIFVSVCVENTDVLCSNGKDDDGDGYTDCNDSNCSGANLCGGSGLGGQPAPSKPGEDGPEDTLERCKDGYDNDGNGYTDCGDFSCSKSSNPDVVAYCADQSEVGPDKCKDGIDNDGNGYTDCNDFSCNKSTDQAVIDVCNGAKEDTLEKCKDGIDNDGNGFLDCADFSCSENDDPAVVTYCDEKAENTLEKCQDGVDNDGNGYMDCNDNACSKSNNFKIYEYCASLQESSEAKCTNGIDDDKDGYPDCNDYSCSDSVAPYTADDALGDEFKTVADFCKSLQEDTWDKCKDGLDNDGDTYIDCSDRSCRSADAWDAINQRHPCQESFEPSDSPAVINGICSDGKDNDGDGFTDCDDWDCAWNPKVTVCEGKLKVCQ
ncbi:MAG TPA: hypothetical protein DCQ06_06880 [Myxococcales bacterium]|nr:hypothetical protein [Myxococcales bacterium]HAN31308.1 hypothetical protein [Myxococcales bacterium]